MNYLSNFNFKNQYVVMAFYGY